MESHQKSSISAEVVDKATQFQLIYIFWLDRYNPFFILQCIDVKGIFINKLEFKITQYADDTTLF